MPSMIIFTLLPSAVIWIVCMALPPNVFYSISLSRRPSWRNTQKWPKRINFAFLCDHKNAAQKGVVKSKVQDVIFGIVAQKSATGMTNQQIADAANVSKTTVDRMLRNDPCTSPTAQTLFDVADAVGCQIGGGQTADKREEEQARLELMREHHAEVIAAYNRALAVKTRWLHFMVALCLVLIALIIAVLLLDVLRSDIGWFRSPVFI